jgi:hypothetical protein
MKRSVPINQVRPPSEAGLSLLLRGPAAQLKNPKNVIVAVKIMFRMATGSKNFQPKSINWSKRKRGSVPLSQM